MVVHPNSSNLSPSGEAGPGSPASSPESLSSSPAPGLQTTQDVAVVEAREARYSEQVSMAGHWEQQEVQGYPVQGPSYNYSMEGFGWGSATHHTTSAFSSRGSGGGLGSPHHLPTMSVNVSMNFPMHGVPAYDHISDQWPTGEFTSKHTNVSSLSVCGMLPFKD